MAISNRRTVNFVGTQGQNDYRDNIAKDVQSHYIRGACLKQPNFDSKTYANKYKQHIYDGNACPEHRDVK